MSKLISIVDSLAGDLDVIRQLYGCSYSGAIRHLETRNATLREVINHNGKEIRELVGKTYNYLDSDSLDIMSRLSEVNLSIAMLLKEIKNKEDEIKVEEWEV